MAKTGWFGRGVPDTSNMIRVQGAHATDAVRACGVQMAERGQAMGLRAFGDGVSAMVGGAAVLADEHRSARLAFAALRGAHKRRQRAHWYRLVTRPNHDERRRQRSKKGGTDTRGRPRHRAGRRYHAMGSPTIPRRMGRCQRQS